MEQLCVTFVSCIIYESGDTNSLTQSDGSTFICTVSKVESVCVRLFRYVSVTPVLGFDHLKGQLDMLAL